MHRLVGHPHVQRAGVGVGIDGDGLDAHPPGRLDDPAGDLAPVRDQDLVEHRLPPPTPSPSHLRAGARRRRRPMSPAPPASGSSDSPRPVSVSAAALAGAAGAAGDRQRSRDQQRGKLKQMHHVPLLRVAGRDHRGPSVSARRAGHRAVSVILEDLRKRLAAPAPHRSAAAPRSPPGRTAPRPAPPRARGASRAARRRGCRARTAPRRNAPRAPRETPVRRPVERPPVGVALARLQRRRPLRGRRAGW